MPAEAKVPSHNMPAPPRHEKALGSSQAGDAQARRTASTRTSSAARCQAVLEFLNEGASVVDVASRNGVVRQTVQASGGSRAVAPHCSTRE
jgi:transposase-like protein